MYKLKSITLGIAALFASALMLPVSASAHDVVRDHHPQRHYQQHQHQHRHHQHHRNHHRGDWYLQHHHSMRPYGYRAMEYRGNGHHQHAPHQVERHERHDHRPVELVIDYRVTL